MTGKTIILGVTGSIAAYKAVSLTRRLIERGADVRVVMTQAATRFVTPLTFEVLSRGPVASELFAAHDEMVHLTWAESASAIVIAPASANLLAKAATGLADDLLSTMLLAATCPVIVAPAMDGGMWEHPAVQQNVQTLRARGVSVLEPESGALASGREGRGRLADERAILAAVEAALAGTPDLAGQRVLISAGPTQEAIDAVRFLSNRSSGKMGYAVAEAARVRGAEVVLVTGPTALTPPSGVGVVSVTTADEMAQVMAARLEWSTIVVMAAAVADFRPARAVAKKLKKTDPAWKGALELEPTRDILTTLSAKRTNQILVGFAAETSNVLDEAKAKLARKGVDLIVGNNVAAPGSGFGSDTSAAVLIDRSGAVIDIPTVPKRVLADRILDQVLTLRGRQARGLTGSRKA